MFVVRLKLGSASRYFGNGCLVKTRKAAYRYATAADAINMMRRFTTTDAFVHVDSMSLELTTAGS